MPNPWIATAGSGRAGGAVLGGLAEGLRRRPTVSSRRPSVLKGRRDGSPTITIYPGPIVLGGQTFDHGLHVEFPSDSLFDGSFLEYLESLRVPPYDARLLVNEYTEMMMDHRLGLEQFFWVDSYYMDPPSMYDELLATGDVAGGGGGFGGGGGVGGAPASVEVGVGDTVESTPEDGSQSRGNNDTDYNRLQTMPDEGDGGVHVGQGDAHDGDDDICFWCHNSGGPRPEIRFEDLDVAFDSVQTLQVAALVRVRIRA